MKKENITKKVLSVIEEILSAGGDIFYPYKSIPNLFDVATNKLSKAVYNLKKHGFLVEIENKNRKQLKLTTKGSIRLIKPNINNHWDGYWRIIAFDIPEKYAKSRRVFRSKLSELNCKPIQKSVWISPDDIAINIEKLINLLHLQGEVNYFICKALNDENKFRRLFNIDKD